MVLERYFLPYNFYFIFLYRVKGELKITHAQPQYVAINLYYSYKQQHEDEVFNRKEKSG